MSHLQIPIIDNPASIYYIAYMIVQIDIPEDILDSARLSADELKVEIALSLYAGGRLAIGKARALAGMNLWQFRQLLASRGISPHFDEQDLLEDVQTLQDLGRL